MTAKTPVFFLVKNRALGDSIMGLSSVQYLRALYPAAKIIYAVPAWVAPLYTNVGTDADVIYPLKLKTFSDVLNLYSDLIDLKVDAIHEMHLSGRGMKVFSLFSFFKRIPFTFHNHHLKKGPVVDQGVIKELIQRDLDGVYSFYGRERVLPYFLDYPPVMKPTIKSKVKRVIMGVVATRKTKMWPHKNYAELARMIAAKFPDFEIVIPLSKGADDQQIKHDLISLGLPASAKIVEWKLEDLPAKFAESTFYIGNDTGLKHLAIAVGIKTYTFFGPEPAREWHPYDSKKHPYFYRDHLACRTRTYHYCGLSVCDLDIHHMECLTYFTPDKVFAQIESEFYM